MADTILVQSNRDDDRVVLYEVNPKHPKGEVFVAGKFRNKLDKNGKAVLGNNGEPVTEPNVVEVSPTALVNRRIAEQQLVKVEPAAKAPAKASPAKTTEDDKK